MPLGVPDDLEKTKTLENHDMLIKVSRDVKWLINQFKEFKNDINIRFDRLEDNIDGIKDELRDEFRNEIKELDQKYKEEIKEIHDTINNEIKPRLEEVEKETWKSIGYKMALGAVGGIIVLLGQIIVDLLH